MTDPFFYGTIMRALAHPFNQVFQQRTPVEALADLPAGIRPCGFIFHMSRCGSTLCSRALATLPENIVVSEPPPLNFLLRSQIYGPATTEQKRVWLAGLINAFGQPRFVEEKRLFIKFMASHVLDLPLIREIYPDVPWLFVYRDPLEIMVSQARQVSSEFVQGQIESDTIGLGAEAAAGMGAEAYVAHCLASLGRAALAHHRPGHSVLLNHSQLPPALTTVLPRAFGLQFSAAEQDNIHAITGRHAKNP